MERCQFCEEPLKGRRDKKFCDSECRTAFHNECRNGDQRMMRAVNKRIRLNRKILKKLCPAGKATIRKEVLEHNGFSFQYFSSIYPTKNQIYFFCYDYGYSPVKTSSYSGSPVIQKVLIVNKQDYMTKPFDPWNLDIPGAK